MVGECVRPRLDYGSLLILVCALDNYLDELTQEIRELEKNKSNDEEWLKQHRTLSIGHQTAKRLKFQFMRYLVGDRGRPPEIWRHEGLKASLKEYELQQRFKQMLSQMEP